MPRRTQNKTLLVFRMNAESVNIRIKTLRSWNSQARTGNLSSHLYASQALYHTDISSTCIILQTHVYGLTVISGDGGDGGGVTGEKGCQATDCSSRLRFNMCE